MTDLIQKLIDLGCVTFGEFVLKSGIRSNIYFDFRRLVSHPKILKMVCELLYQKCFKERKDEFYVSGVPYAGIPYAQTISVLHDIPLVMTRKEAKEYGLKTKVSGKPNIVLIDDVITTGGSIMKTIADLKEFNVVEIIVLVDRRTPELRGKLAVTSLFDVNDFYNNRMEKIIRQLIIGKKSNICLALDVRDKGYILETLKAVADKIVIVKINSELITDFDSEFISQLKELTVDKGVIIMEDRKYCEIGNTFALQFCNGELSPYAWADVISMHGISGEGQLKVFKDYKKVGQGIFLILEMSSQLNLISRDYRKKIIEMGHKYRTEVSGFITRNDTPDGFLNIITGVNSDRSYDDDDQTYIRPEVAMKNGADLVIVGRGITDSKDGSSVEDACERYRKICWENYRSGS